jgi:hypothetical protein
VTVDQARRRQAFARWHRRAALVVFAWLVALALTGLLINHAHDWGFDRQPLPGWLAQPVYGVTAVDEALCPAGIPSPGECAEVFARLELPSGSLLLTPTTAFYFGKDGALVESLSAPQLGLDRIEAAYRDDNRIVLKGPRRAVSADLDLMSWHPLAQAVLMDIPDGRWQGQGDHPGTVTWERFLLDAHAARFLGPAAPFFTDLMAGLILFLAISGIVLWWLKRRRRRETGAD